MKKHLNKPIVMTLTRIAALGTLALLVDVSPVFAATLSRAFGARGCGFGGRVERSSPGVLKTLP